MKSGSAPGAAELSRDLGAGGCRSSSRSVGAGSGWGREEARSMELLTLTSVQAVHGGPMGKGSLLPATCAAFGHVIPGQILCYAEE